MGLQIVLKKQLRVGYKDIYNKRNKGQINQKQIDMIKMENLYYNKMLKEVYEYMMH